MKADDDKRLTELGKEKARPERIVADQAVDIDMPKDVKQEAFCARGAVNHLIGASKHRVYAVEGQFRSTQRRPRRR